MYCHMLHVVWCQRCVVSVNVLLSCLDLMLSVVTAEKGDNSSILFIFSSDTTYLCNVRLSTMLPFQFRIVF